LLMLWVAIPVAVVERPGMFRSLSRSRELTRGFRWRLLGVLLVIFVASTAASWLVELILNPVFEPVIKSIVTLVVQTAFTALWAVASAVSYYMLRTSKEGVEIEQIAAVFD